MRFSFLWFFFILTIPSPAKPESFHTVKPGESLSRIAKKFQVSAFQLQEANGLRDEKIYPGQRLVIPVPPSKAEINPTAREAAQQGAWETVGDLQQINQLSGKKLKAGQTFYLQRVEEAQEELEAGRKKSEGEDLPERAEFARAQVKGKGFLLDGKDRELLVRVAQGFLGLKYNRGGSTPNGLDCSAFVQKVFSIFGIDLPRTAREQFQVGYEVAREALRMGDLVFFKRSKTPRPTHVGIYIGDGRFIHTSLRKRRVDIDSIDSRYFANRFIGAKRIEEVQRPPEIEESTRDSAALPRE
jgi:cell wall-associated NlpC family hydrolase